MKIDKCKLNKLIITFVKLLNLQREKFKFEFRISESCINI